MPFRAGSKKVTAIGGGTGLPVVLNSLKDWVDDLSAVVTMADDGGSSGRLRREMGILPPGDLRNCLVALAAEDNGLAPFFQYRFPDDTGLKRHSLGNLILAALMQSEAGLTGALEIVSGLLDVKGSVIPSTLDPITLCATTKLASKIKGQAVIARSGPLETVYLEPPAKAYGPAISSIEQSDALIFGPGSLFTSIIPVILVGGIAEVVHSSPALKVYVCNTANQRKETKGFSSLDYLDALERHAGASFIDVLVINEPGRSEYITAGGRGFEAVRPVEPRDRDIKVVKTDLTDAADPLKHDPAKLRRVLEETLSKAGAYG